MCQIPLKVTFLMPVSLRTGFILLALNKFELTGMYVRTYERTNEKLPKNSSM